MTPEYRETARRLTSLDGIPTNSCSAPLEQLEYIRDADRAGAVAVRHEKAAPAATANSTRISPPRRQTRGPMS